MPFPQQALDRVTEIYTGSWQDITSHMLDRADVVITRGVPNEGSAEPSQLSGTLNNRDGRYSPRNPTSPLFGKIGRYTPIRHSVRLLQDTFARTETDTWGSADTGESWQEFWTNGAITDFDVAGGAGTMVVDGTVEYRAAWLHETSFHDVEVRAEVSFDVSDVTGGPVEPGNLILRALSITEYYLARVQVNADDTVTLIIFDPSGAALGTLTEVDGLTYSGQILGVAASCEGPIFRMKVWDTAGGEPLHWQLTAVDDSVAPYAGGVGIRNGVGGGNTDTPVTFSVHGFEARAPQIYAEVPAWPQRWDLSGQDAWVPLQASGLRRRLTQGNPPKLSAMRRSILSEQTTKPNAYWPLEDGNRSRAAGSAFPGGPPLVLHGSGPGPILGSGGDTIPPGSGGAWDFTGGGSVPFPYVLQANPGGFLVGSTGIKPELVPSWEVQCTVQWRALPDPPESTPPFLWRILSVSSPVGFATGGGFHLVWSGTEWYLNGFLFYDGSPSSLAPINQDALVLYPGAPMHLRLVVYEGTLGIIDARLFVNGQYLSFVGTGVGTDDIGAPTQIEINRGGTDSLGAASANPPSISHAAIWVPARETDEVATQGFTTAAPEYLAVDGYAGETAARRVERVCGEVGVPVAIVGDANQASAMGPQQPGSIMNILDDAAATDLGALYEPRDAAGFVFRTRQTIYNQPAKVALTYGAKGEVPPGLQPLDDDLDRANILTVSRPGGSSVIVQRETGPLSIQDPPDGIGPSEGQASANVVSDLVLPAQGQWRLHLSTWDEARWPVVPLNLAALGFHDKHDLQAAAAALNIRDRLTIDELAEQPGQPHDQVSLLVDHLTVTLGMFRWSIDATCSPEGPWHLLEVGHALYSIVGSESATIAEALDETETAVDINCGAGADWVHEVDFDILIGGERMTVTATGAVSGTFPNRTQTLTVVRSVNGIVKAHGSGAPVSMAEPVYIGL